LLYEISGEAEGQGQGVERFSSKRSSWWGRSRAEPCAAGARRSTL